LDWWPGCWLLFPRSDLTLAFISESESVRAITGITRMATITRTAITGRIRIMATITGPTIGTADTDTITATIVTTTITIGN
jgi:hypothetical protein